MTTDRLVLVPAGPEHADDLVVLYAGPDVAHWYAGTWTSESGLIHQPGLVEGRPDVQPSAPFALYRSRRPGASTGRADEGS